MKKLASCFKRLLIEGVQHGMAGAIRRGAGALRNALAEVRGHAAERPLINPPILGARERHAVMFELDDRGRRLLAHELDGVLIAQPIRALDRVVHVPAPVIGAHVAERRGDPALRRDRVAARGKHLGQAGGRQTRLGQTKRRAQSRPAGADHHHIVAVIDEFVVAHIRGNPNATRKMANIAARAGKHVEKSQS
jgi:hypothetical protein